jgi:hypothetical protein
MRSYVLTLGLLLAGAGPALAQTTVAVGAKAGVNFANLNFEGDTGGVEFDNKTGFVGGLFVVAPANGQFALQAEALFSQKGAKLEEGGNSATVRLDMLDIPVLARISSAASNGASFHLFGGPSFNFKLSAKQEFEFAGVEEEEDLDDEVKGFETAFVVGAGVEFGRLVLDGRYSWGLTDLNNEEEEDVKVKTRVFSFMVGFRF